MGRRGRFEWEGDPQREGRRGCFGDNVRSSRVSRYCWRASQVFSAIPGVPSQLRATLSSHSPEKCAGRFLPTRALSGRQDYGTTQPRDYRTPRQPRSPSRCGSPRAHPPSPKNASLPLTSCGSSPTLRGLKIVPSQVNRRPDTLKNSPKADPITIIIIVNSPILRIFRRLLLFSNE